MVEILDLRRFAPIPGRIISECLVGFVGMRNREGPQGKNLYPLGENQ